MEKLLELQPLVLEWAHKKLIFKLGTPKGQAEKTTEEAEELQLAIDEKDEEAIKDAIGDCLVTLIIQAEMQGLDLGDCLEHSYKIISKRQGSMLNGVFVKEEVNEAK